MKTQRHCIYIIYIYIFSDQVFKLLGSSFRQITYNLLSKVQLWSARGSYRYLWKHPVKAYLGGFQWIINVQHHIAQKQPLLKYSIQVLQDFESLVLLLECVPGLSKTKDLILSKSRRLSFQSTEILLVIVNILPNWKNIDIKISI